MHIDHVLRKASSPLYILRVCKFYGYPKEQLDLLIQRIIICLHICYILRCGVAVIMTIAK